MNGVSGVGPPGNILPQEPVRQVTDPNEDMAVDFFHGQQYVGQIAAIGKEKSMEMRKAW